MAGKIDLKVAKLEVQLAGILPMLKKMDEKIDGLDHVIRGNGAPGLSEKISSLKVEVVELKGDKSRLMNAVYGAVGGLAVGLVMFLVQHFYR